MARYYQSKDTVPISQHVDLPLDFMQQKAEAQQTLLDDARKDLDASLQLTYIPNTVDYETAVTREKAFQEELSSAAKYLETGDVSSTRAAIQKAQKTYGLTVNDNGEVTYSPTSVEGNLFTNREAYDNYMKNVQAMAKSGDISSPTEWYAIQRSLDNYNALGGSENKTAWEQAAYTPKKDINIEEFVNDFSTGWNSDKTEKWAGQLDDFGHFVGTRGYESITEEDVSKFVGQLFDGQSAYREQLMAEYAYSQGDVNSIYDVNENGETVYSDGFLEYELNEKKRLQSMMANKIGFGKTDITPYRSVQGDIDVGVGIEKAKIMMEGENVYAANVNNVQVTPETVTTLTETSNNAQSSIDAATASETKYTNAFNDILNETLGIKDFGFIGNMITGMDKYNEAIKESLGIDEGDLLTYSEDGKIAINENASDLLLKSGVSEDKVQKFMTDGQLAINEVNTSIDAKNKAKWQKHSADLQLEDINNKMEDTEFAYDWNGIYTFDWDGVYKDDLTVVDIEPTDLSEKVVRSLLEPLGAENIKRMVITGDYSMLDDLLVDKSQFERNQVRGILGIYNADYNNHREDFLKSGKYTTSIVTVGGGNDKFGINAAAKHFTELLLNNAADGINNIITINGGTVSDDMGDLGFILDSTDGDYKPITYETTMGMSGDKVVYYVKATQGNMVKDLTPIDLVGSNQPHLIADAKEQLSAQWAMEDDTDYNVGTDSKSRAIISRMYGNLITNGVVQKGKTLDVGKKQAITIDTNAGTINAYIKRSTDNQYQIIDSNGIAYTEASDLETQVSKIGEIVLDYETTDTHGYTVGSNKALSLKDVGADTYEAIK